MTFLEAALEILKREGKALHFKELTERAMSKKLLTFVGRTPEVTMQAQLTAAVKKAPGSPFVRVKPGVFGLLRYPELTAEEKAAIEKEADKEKGKSEGRSESRTEADKGERRRGKPRENAAAESSAQEGRRRRRRRGGRGRGPDEEATDVVAEGKEQAPATRTATSAVDDDETAALAAAKSAEEQDDAHHDDGPATVGGLSAEARAAALAETGVLNDDDDEDEDGEDADDDEGDDESLDQDDGDEESPVAAEDGAALEGTSNDSEDDDQVDDDESDDDDDDDQEDLEPPMAFGNDQDAPASTQGREAAEQPATSSAAGAEGEAEGDEDEGDEDDARDPLTAGAEGGAPREGDEFGGRRRRRRRRRRRGGAEGGFGGPNEGASNAGESRGAGPENTESGAPNEGREGDAAAAASVAETDSLPLESQQGPRRISTPVDAAIEILKSQAPGRGMHVRQLSDAAVRRRLVHGEPNEAWRVMRAALAAEPKERLRAGRRPRVRSAGSGLFALARRPPEGDLEKAETVFAEARRALRERTMVALEKRLAELPTAAFEALARVLLQREGFGPATFVKRVEGTIYIEALRGRGVRPSKCLVALRSGGTSAGRRAIGELRAGVRARNQDEGLLFLAGRLAEDAIAEWKQPGPPIEIADGAALAETCVRHGLGVVSANVAIDFVDADFFTELAEG